MDPITFDEDSKLLEDYVKTRLLPTQMVPIGLEYSEYEPAATYYEDGEGLKDNRLI